MTPQERIPVVAQNLRALEQAKANATDEKTLRLLTEQVAITRRELTRLEVEVRATIPGSGEWEARIPPVISSADSSLSRFVTDVGTAITLERMKAR